VSYRNLLLTHGAAFSGRDVAYDKPDDNHGNPVAEHLPRAKNANGEYTASTLRHVIARAAEVLKGRGANGIWPWSGGKAGAIHSIPARYGVRGAIIAAVDVINGLGRVMGLDVIKVPGATGYIDTDFEGKADAAIKAVRDGYDFVYVHLEATDEVSHAQDLALKTRVIEDFDSRIIGRVRAAIGDGAAYCVLPDHPVPIHIGKHTRTPVPVSVYQPGVAPDAVEVYSEKACLEGALGAMKGSRLMDLLLGASASMHG
jgi:2,3-bisphosphoglycerate-independent phosphoglycerate mutase